MEFNKFQRVVWTVNGALIFVALVYLGINEIRNNYIMYQYYESPELIVGIEAEDAKKSGVALQGLIYENPIKIEKTNSYILPVSVKTYTVPKEMVDEMAKSAGDISPDVGTITQMVNVVFLDSNFENPKILLDKKGYIGYFKYPHHQEEYRNADLLDESIENMGYIIGFEDSNKDGVLNDYDDADLYLSDLGGNNFLKITSNINISDFQFQNSNEMLIEYYKRGAESQEHKRKYFSKYLIKEKKLIELSKLDDSLNTIEKIIIQ